jgi:hypothetical protein
VTRAARAALRLTIVGGALLLPREGRSQVVALRDLGFGTIISGTTTSVAPTDVTSAEWRITGILGLFGSVTFTLPSSLTRAGGSETMPVSFCGTCGKFRVNNSSPAGGTTFDPKVGVSGLGIVVLSSIYLWVGGSVSPPLAQRAGSYSGTIIMTSSSLL